MHFPILASLLLVTIFLLVSSSLLPLLMASLLLLVTSFVSCSSLLTLSLDLYLLDETAVFMVYITFVVLMASLLLSPTDSPSLSFSFYFILLSCLFVFMSSNLFLIYIAYELSLLPIIIIIIQFGSYSDRLSASLYLLAFTSVFALPFSFLLFSFFSSSSSLSLCTFSITFSYFSSFFTLLTFFSFAVKLPIYGLHHWLPLAHVEAPTFGSMILAGVLLKLGGVGLLRFSSLMSFSFIKSTMMAYFIFFMTFVTVFCLAQSDFKRLVAYSSVSHMMLIPILYSLDVILSLKVLIMVMFFHALSSPLLFSLVGSSYSIFSSRMLAFSRGLLTITPFLSFLVLMGFVLTMSVPPTPSFIAEVLFVVSLFSFIPSSFLFILLFVVLSLVYNLHWFTPIVFQSPAPEVVQSFSTTSKESLSNVFLIFVNFPFLLLLPLF